MMQIYIIHMENSLILVLIEFYKNENSISLKYTKGSS